MVSFDKKVKKNQEMRIKYSDNPEKWVFSWEHAWAIRSKNKIAKCLTK